MTRGRPVTRRRPGDVGRALDDLYATLPTVDCRGRCAMACRAIRMTGAERRRIVAAGVTVSGRLDRPCEALTVLNRCGVYAVRPAICRLYGVADGLLCPFGCRPADGRAPLTYVEAGEFLAAAHEIAGEPATAARIRAGLLIPDAGRLLSLWAPGR